MDKDSIRLDSLLGQVNFDEGSCSPNKQLKLPFKKRSFNMIEVVVSLFLILVVLVTSVSLFTSGLQDNKEASNRNYANDSMDQFIHQFASRIEKDWTEINAFPDVKYALSDNLAMSQTSLMSSATYQLYYATNDELASYDPAVNQTGVYKIISSTGTLGADFTGEIRAWKSEVTMSNLNIRVTLYAEISWPITKDYADRTKLEYQTEVYQSVAVSVAETGDLDTPCKTIWAIVNDQLYYFVLSEGSTFSNIEGTISGATSIEAEGLAFSSGGTIFFMDNSSANSTLYSITTDDFDQDPSTGVTTTLVGSTGLTGNNQIGAMIFIGNDLYGITTKSKKLYKINSSTASVSLEDTLDFTVGGMAVASDGQVYLVRSKSAHSMIYVFDNFGHNSKGGNITAFVTIAGSQSIESLTAHPNELLYMADSTKWYKVDISSKGYAVELNLSRDIKGFADNYNYEVANCDDEEDIVVSCDLDGAITGAVNLSPSNSPQSVFCLTIDEVAGTYISREDPKTIAVDSDGTAYERGPLRKFVLAQRVTIPKVA
ncbi:MAG: hypothetical protein HRT89_03995 [Lentisphaeria bacterium]|nr:hypothetical protein [Lentisphaeria bacterium]NQZ67212.1 hypothetical protein [Lentisphaeria bacterium]